MKTFLAQNQFIPNSTVIPEPPAVASTADGERRLQNVARPDVTAEREPHLISNSALASAMTADTDAAPDLTDPPVAAAVLIADPDGGYMGPRLSPALGTSVSSAVTEPWTVTADLIAEPSMTNGGDQGAPASAPTKNPDAGVLGTEHIHEIFHWVRKLMKQPPRFVLDADAFMAEVEEVPLFLRDDDGYLRRQA